MNAAYEFSIDKSRMVQLVICLCVIGVLLFFTGIATGVYIRPQAVAWLEPPAQSPEAAKPLAKKEADASVAVAAAKDSKPAEPAPQPPVTPAASASSAPASSASAAAAEKPVDTAKATVKADEPKPEVQESGQPGLAVFAGSFHEESNAVRLANLLKRHGFGPVLVGQTDAQEGDWHFVRLGPYRAWDDASRIAEELDRSFDLHAYIHPITVWPN